MAKIKIVGMLSGEGTTVEAIIQMCNDGSIPAEVVGIISDVPCNGLTRITSKYKIPGAIIPLTKEPRLHWDSAVTTVLDMFLPDLICLGGFMRILGPETVQAYKGKILNIHPGHLPLLAGKDPQKKAIALGLSQTGNTVHVVTGKVDDDSDVLATDTIDIPSDTTLEDLCYRLTLCGHITYKRAIWNWIQRSHISIT